MNKFKAAPQAHIVPALKRIASALQSESITPEEVSYRLAMVRMALSQTAQQAVEAMGPIQADSREKVMDGFSKANPALTQDQLEEIADQWEKNKDVVKDQSKTAAADRSLDWVKSHADKVEEYEVDWTSSLVGYSKKKWNSLDGNAQKEYEAALKRKALKPRYRAWEGDVFYDISKDTYEKSKALFKTAAVDADTRDNAIDECLDLIRKVVKRYEMEIVKWSFDDDFATLMERSTK